ncbi:hypothetical protein [Nocardia sp. N2S4-5]|uniref:hypothetical protein n=1 Tax=Nocardia sp. N2S4-5 TaxID=3351565 RepID=UPI0037D13C16
MSVLFAPYSAWGHVLPGASFGRVLFTSDALPAVCLASHLVEDDGTVVVRAGLAAPPVGMGPKLMAVR